MSRRIVRAPGPLPSPFARAGGRDAATPVGRLDDEFIDERGAAFVEQCFIKNDGDETDYDLIIRGDEVVVYFGRPVHRVQD